MNDNDQFMSTWLKEEVLHITKKNINVVPAVISISKTILVYLYLARNALAVKAWTNEYVLQTNRLATYDSLVLVRLRKY